MLVGKRMSHPVITISPDTPIIDALNLMKREHIRRLPVVMDGKLVGIVSDKEIMNASPSGATSLSVWELNYLVSKILVKDIMTKEVITVQETDSLEKAARLMADNKIGGLPVMRNDQLVGIITETDLFKLFIELMGAREKGVRVTALISNESGTWAKIAKAIADAGGNFIAFGQFAGETPNNRLLTFKVSGLDLEKVQSLITPLVEEIEDIRLSLGE